MPSLGIEAKHGGMPSPRIEARHGNTEPRLLTKTSRRRPTRHKAVSLFMNTLDSSSQTLESTWIPLILSLTPVLIEALESSITGKRRPGTLKQFPISSIGQVLERGNTDAKALHSWIGLMESDAAPLHSTSLCPQEQYNHEIHNCFGNPASRGDCHFPGT